MKTTPRLIRAKVGYTSHFRFFCFVASLFSQQRKTFQTIPTLSWEHYRLVPQTVSRIACPVNTFSCYLVSSSRQHCTQWLSISSALIYSNEDYSLHSEDNVDGLNFPETIVETVCVQCQYVRRVWSIWLLVVSREWPMQEMNIASHVCCHNEELKTYELIGFN